MQNRRFVGRLILLCAGYAALSMPELASAATDTWTGGGTSAAWDYPKIVSLNIVYPNWGNVLFVPGTNDDVTFANSFASGNPNLNGSRNVHSVTINSTTTFSITGSSGNIFTFPTLTRTATSSGSQTFSTQVDLAGNSLWSIDGSGSLVMANSVAEATTGSALTKTGAGQLTLGAGTTDTTANSWTGLTTISAGFVQLNKAAGTDAIDSNIRINGGTLRLNNSEQIDNSSSVELDSGTLDLNGFSETIAQLTGSGGTVATGASTGDLIVNQSTTSSANCSFNGAGILDKTGAGTLSIASPGSNLLGGFQTDAGTLNLKGNYTLFGSNVLAVNGGAMTINDTSTIALNGNAYTVYADSGGTLNIDGFHTTVALPFQTFAGIGGNGIINISAATVNVNQFLGASFSGGSTGTINIIDGAQVNVPNLFAGAQLKSTGTINISDAGTLVSDTNYVGIGGADSSAADGGGTGTIYVSYSAALTTPYLNFYASNLGALIVNQATVTAGVIQELDNGVGRIEISDGSTSALVLGDNIDFTYTGVIADYVSGLSGSLTKIGSDTLTLTNNANSFTGPVYINGGEVSVANIADSGAPCPLGAGSEIAFGGGTLDYTGSNIAATSRTVLLSGSGGTIEVDSGGLLLGDVSSASGVTPSLTKTGLGPLIVGNVSAGSVNVLRGSLSIFGGASATAMNISLGASLYLGPGGAVTGPIGVAGTLELAGPLSTDVLSGNGTVTIDAPSGMLTVGTGNSSYSFPGSINGDSNGALTKVGTGTIALSGTNTYTGSTTISAGTLVLDNSLTSAGAAITISSGATLQASGFLQRQILGNGNLNADGALFVGSTTSAYAFPGTLNVDGNSVQLISSSAATLGVSTTLTDGGNLTSIGGFNLPAGNTLSSTGNAVVTGSLANNGSVLAGTSMSDSLIFTDNVSGSGSFSGNIHFQKVFAPTGSVTAGTIILDSTAVAKLSISLLNANSLINNGQFLQNGGLAVINGAITGTGGISISGGVLVAQSISQTALDISGGRSVGIVKHSDGGGTSVLQAIQISGSGKLDLTNEDLIIDYQGASPIAQVAQYLASGYANGAWDGLGISSTVAQSTMGTALGYGESVALGLNTFGGIGVDSTAVLIGYTWYGDANLDGVVNSADLSMMSAAGSNWTQGDFNYDGKVNADDYALFALGLAASNGANISAILPEPAALSSLALLLYIPARRRARCS